jgi:phenylalanyl-tRNA synthetase beta chain
MKIPYRWLRELVETDAPAEQAAERLTMAGIEVAGVTPVVTGLAGVVVGEITGIAPHPAGSPLAVCQVSSGRDPVAVVCGAPNVRAGARAAFAPPGAVLPGGRRIEAVTIKGVVSHGMLCSEAELGIGDDAGTILLFGGEVPVGADLVARLGLDDVVLEVEVTPNRPDCLSVLGIAREVAALTRGRLTPPPTGISEHDPAAATLASARIDDADLCPRFCARVITGVTVGPSPAWLAQRLRASGLRPINNVVDVTNYVMWELGHPLHAFDHALLKDHRIVVRRARPGEVLVTLDGQTRTLNDAMLVIADAERAVSVAGVMGGASTEVGPATRTILLEAAYFKPGSVRRTARALGLSTEASYRFERGADVEGPPPALERAARLIAELAGGRVARGVVDVYPSPRPRRELSLRLGRIQRVLGACPPKPQVGEILDRLGFPVEERDGGFAVEVPSFRRDVSLEDDLVEEVARVWGYAEIPSTLPSGTLTLTRRPRSVLVPEAVRRALTAAGLDEAVNISLLDPDRLHHLGWALGDSRVVVLQNPLAADRSILRPTLLFGLLDAVVTNVRRQRPDARFFEIGRVYESQGPGKLPLEDTRVGVVLTGLRHTWTWHSGKVRADVFDAKGAVEAVVGALGRGAVTVEALEPGSAPYLEEGRGATVVVQGTPVGVFGELHPAVQRAFDLPAPVFFAELSVDRLDSLEPRRTVIQPIPRFPAIERDVALVVPAAVSAADVDRAFETIRASIPLLKQVQLFDLYSGEQVGAGRKSLAYSLLYQAEDRTLTDAEVNAMHQEVVERLQQGLGAEVRGAGGGEVRS